MADLKLTRPENDNVFTQRNEDKDMMAYMVFFGVSKQAAYLRFHPDARDGNTGKLDHSGSEECRQFFGKQENKDFVASYKETLKRRLSGVEIEMDERMAEEKDQVESVKELLRQAAQLMKNGVSLDAATLKLIADLYIRVGFLKEEREQEIRPVRFLPVRCKSECRYRLYCESMVLEGLAIDECQFCKARSKAEELGYKFKDTELLDIPEDVVKRLDEKNNVKLEDILSGKVEN